VAAQKIEYNRHRSPGGGSTTILVDRRSSATSLARSGPHQLKMDNPSRPRDRLAGASQAASAQHVTVSGARPLHKPRFQILALQLVICAEVEIGRRPMSFLFWAASTSSPSPTVTDTAGRKPAQSGPEIAVDLRRYPVAKRRLSPAICET
jgi:hypothetical protein